jgi:4'-phosphopantetheinyl transferase
VPVAQDSKVDVWWATLDVEGSAVRELEAHLSEEERERADRALTGDVRRRFVVGRGLLRELLARYAGALPSELHFCYGPHGKPGLDVAQGGHELRFNLSHSGGLVLFAIAAGLEVGIDVELIRPALARGPIAEQLFAPREVGILRSLPPEEQPAAFFRCWTRKEAVLKAASDRLALFPNEIEVTLAPGEPPALLGTGSNDVSECRWLLSDVELGPELAAALAVEARPR